MSGKYRLPGYYGLTIYGILFLYTFLRILQSIFSQPTNQIKYLNYKLGFHFVFALFCLFEGIYSYSLTIDDRYGRLTALLLSLPLTMIQHHLVGIFLPFCCFIFQCGFFFIGPLPFSLLFSSSPINSDSADRQSLGLQLEFLSMLLEVFSLEFHFNLCQLRCLCR
jgi:hypothetical protein